MTRYAVGAGLLLWAGLALILSAVGPLSRPGLADRIRPHSPWPSVGSGGRGDGRADVLSAVAGPLAMSVGSRAAGLFGFGELGARLRRVHATLDPAAFRMRQLAGAVATVLGAAALMAVSRPPAIVGLAAVPACVLAAYAVTEYRLNQACARWARRRRMELPIVTEQLAMLIAAGFSVGSALARVAGRGNGAVATDLRVVCLRMRQGVGLQGALREWSETASSPPVDRLVSVLTLAHETTDVARLLSEEARLMRRAVQRETVEVMERRSQQVWIPVTVAALVPGVVIIAVPFIQALRVFSAG